MVFGILLMLVAISPLAAPLVMSVVRNVKINRANGYRW
jgi:hypothetical protein